jgi:hypothetical protein
VLNANAYQMMLMISDATPTAMPATASPWPPDGLLDLVQGEHPEHDADDGADPAQDADQRGH